MPERRKAAGDEEGAEAPIILAATFHRQGARPSRIVVPCAVKALSRAFPGGLADLSCATRGEAGNLAYGCFKESATPRRMTFVEEWRRRADIDAHLAQPETQAFLAMHVAMLAEPPRVRACAVARIEPLV